MGAAVAMAGGRVRPPAWSARSGSPEGLSRRLQLCLVATPTVSGSGFQQRFDPVSSGKRDSSTCGVSVWEKQITGVDYIGPRVSFPQS